MTGGGVGGGGGSTSPKGFSSTPYSPIASVTSILENVPIIEWSPRGVSDHPLVSGTLMPRSLPTSILFASKLSSLPSRIMLSM
jgi:hypothetical protein